MRTTVIEGFGGRYSINEFGVVTGTRGPIAIQRSNSGYLFVNLWDSNRGYSRFVHRLLAKAFVQRTRPEQLEVNHRDGNPLNNALSNLEWVTHVENVRHAYEALGRVSSAPMFGAANPIARAVVRVDLKTAESLPFACIADAVRAGYNAACIVETCRGKQRTHRGYGWRYA